MDINILSENDFHFYVKSFFYIYKYIFIQILVAQELNPDWRDTPELALVQLVAIRAYN